MANMIDYVRWRGDIPLDQVPLGEVDALILSYLSYMPYDGIVGGAFSPDGMLLGEAAAYFLAHQMYSACMIDSDKEDCMLLGEIENSVRFGSLRLAGYENRFDEQTQEQFSAVTFLAPHGPAFIAFRGTDSTVVGWKEDFNMSFEREVPAQRAAVEYAARAAQEIGGEMVLGGHSKGGNLAAYAAVFAPEDVQSRIGCVYNFDGPGFNETVIASPEFEKVDMRIHTFVPQSSMIGILLWHGEDFTVVSSDAGGLFQHNPYTWQVMGGQLIKLSDRTKESRLAEETIKHWLTGLAPQERRQIIDGIYDVLSVSDGRNVSDLFEGKNVRAILRAVGSMDEETKDAITEAFRRLGSSFKETLPDWFDRTAGQIRTMIASKTGDKKDDARG